MNHASGALSQLIELNVGWNEIGDVGMAAFAQAIKPVNEGGSGARSQLTKLWLSENKIGDAGVSARAGACASGALPKLGVLKL